ncbi:hypothetical protein EBR25_06065 [bacterium]|nr:hypothetical protein [bacterium]
MKQTRFFLFVFLVFLFIHSSSHATPSLRGFQIPVSVISEEVLTELRDEWNVNFLRIQVGNNDEMDGTTGEAYNAMMETQFALLDQKLPLIQAAGLQIVFILYSPPGGFETRESPSHYAMFSDRTLQNDFIDKWEEIIVRYGEHPAILGFDIVNEPALRDELFGGDAVDWNTLLLETIAAIRVLDSEVPLVVKGLYGSPYSLKDLPAIDDENIEFAYNAYFFNSYQHTGVDSDPFSLSRPEQKKIQRKIRMGLAPFLQKVFKATRQGELSNTAYPPKLSIGEVAVSACAQDGALFLADTLEELERDNSEESHIKLGKRGKLKLTKAAREKFTGKKKKRAFINDIAHTNYAVHAYMEAQIWDPRSECSLDGTLSLASEDTDRAIVLKSYFSRNSS